MQSIDVPDRVTENLKALSRNKVAFNITRCFTIYSVQFTILIQPDESLRVLYIPTVDKLKMPPFICCQDSNAFVS
jgi:hypothetical protein